MEISQTQPASILYLIYDGDCVLCRNITKALKIKKAVGALEVINGRSSHPLVKEAYQNHFNLNEGILVKFNDKYYYGADAMHFLALVGSPSDLFNKINVYVFSSKYFAKYGYSLFKIIRNILLIIQNISPLTDNHNASLSRMIFGNAVSKLPKVLQRRYNIKPYSHDKILLKGRMNIYVSKIFSLLLPFVRLTSTMVTSPANGIPVEVELKSDPQSSAILMQRIFYYPDRAPHFFSTHIIHIKDNMVIESMKFRIVTTLLYYVDDNKIVMKYGGYAFYICKWLIPIPLGFIIGKFFAYEEAVDEETFKIQVRIIHPLFGRIWEYNGQFKIAHLDD